MKNGWQRKRLGDLCGIELGKTPPRADLSCWDKARETNNVWLSIADLLNAKDNCVTDSKEYISDKGAAMSKIVPKGTLLVSFKLTLGRLAYAGCNLYTNEAIAALTLHNDREISKEFLFYYLLAFDWDKAAEGDVKIKGKTLNKAKLREIAVRFPPLAEQRRIVGVLDEALAGIATARAAAATNLQNARALFASHLQSVFTHRGKGWVEKKLAEVCSEIVAGGDVPKGRVSKERTPKYCVPIFANGEKDDGLYGFTDIARMTKPSVTVSARGTLGFTAIRTEPFFPVVRLIVLVPDEKLVLLRFLYYAVVGMDFGNTGTSIPQLTVPNFKESKLHVPSLSEQKVIVAKLDALAAATGRLAGLYERKVGLLEELQKSLLHRAFAGEL